MKRNRGVQRWRRFALDSAYQNHETGKHHGLLRELGVNPKDDDYSETEVIAPEASQKNFLNIGGEPNEPPLNVADSIPQRQVKTELDREPTFEEFGRTLNEMKVPAPSDDEITVDMIKTAPIQIPECIFQLLVNMWREADNEGKQKHWSPAVRKAIVLMLYKRKGIMQSLDNYRGFAYCR